MLNEIQKASRDQFDKQSGNYGKSHILADTSDIDAALSGCVLPAGGRALDIATGGGHTAVYLAGRGMSVVAADISPAMLANARRLAEEQGFGIETQLHEAERLPYAGGTFDLVSCRVAAHHFSDPRSFVSEAARVLKPGGFFLLIDGSVPDGEPVAEEWIHRIEKLRDPSHGRFLTPSAWRELCASAELAPVLCETRPFKQPDLDWYFQTAGTQEPDRVEVRRLVQDAPAAARRVFGIAEEDGKTVWWWLRLSLLARK